MLNWRRLGRFACSFTLLVGAVSWTRPSAATKIACVGDSITYGYNLSNPSQQSWPAVLQTLVGSVDNVQNFGSSGCTLLSAGDKPYVNDPAYSASTAFKPELVIVMLGTNDAKPQNWSHKADFANNYSSLISVYRQLGAQVYVAVPPPVYPPGAYDIDPAVFSGEVVPLIHQIATDANAPLIDVFQALSNKSSYFPDTVHPNVAGQQLIAQTVAAALQQNSVGGAGGTTSTGGTAAGTGGKIGVGGASSNIGGTSGAGGATKGMGGTATTIGGTATTGGTTSGAGGTASSIAAMSGTGGTLKGTGGTATSTVNSSSNSGGTTNSMGGAATSVGGFSSSIGSTFGGGRTTSAGASATETAGGSSSAGTSSPSTQELLGGTGNATGATSGEAGSSRLASGGNTALGASPVGSSDAKASASSCNCRVFGERPARQLDYLGALLSLALLKLRRRKG